MGFRSTMTTEDIWLPIPDWFVEKHNGNGLFIQKIAPSQWLKTEVVGTYNLPMSYRFEHKWHTEFLEDLQRVIKEQPDDADKRDKVELIFFHECDGVTRVRVTADKIRYFEPQEWEEVDDITHSYCYGCSEPAHTKLPQPGSDKPGEDESHE